MVRSSCARLAVLFFALASATVTTTAVRSAFAGSGCVTTPTGIECDYSGSTTSTMTATTPPLRYLVTANDPVVGPCWYWSPYPPGLDSWDSANDAAIINTRWALPACPTETASTTTTTTSTAWEVFRSFDLSRPSPVLRPVVGITNLPTLLGVDRPLALSHDELLPDGNLLQVRADVERETGDDPVFDGYYIYGSYFLTGDSRNYKADKGLFDIIQPAHPFRLQGDGWGAWELATRYSVLDLNDADVNGGEERNVTLGLNWYPNSFVRLMANYVHVLDIDGGVHDNEDLDLFQVRAQVAY